MSSPVFDVIVCGSLHLDIMVYAPNLPRPDETTVGARWEMACGGKGGNQAVMAARAGARVAMIGRVGADDFGTRLLSNLEAHSVDARAVTVDKTAGSGMSTAIVRDDGDYGAVIVSGSNLKIDPDAVVRAWNELGGARALILQNEIPEAVNQAIAAVARADGAVVILNAAPARAIVVTLRELVDVLVVNRIEAEMLSGVVVNNAESAIAAIPKIGMNEANLIVTLGGEGLVVAVGAAPPTVIAPKRVAVISTHGAGDCFVGALAARLAGRASLLEAARHANAAAAAHVSDPDRRG